MSGLFTVVVVMCASALICSLVQTFVTDGSTKKIISLVLGAFIICCMVVPVKNAVSSFNTDIEEKQNSVKEISTDDEAYSNAVIKQTEINLETALKNLLLQNNIIIKSCDIILSRVENNGIIIASISIYIDKEFVRYTNLVSSIVYDNFGIMEEKTSSKLKSMLNSKKIRNIIIVVGLIGIGLIFLSNWIDFGSLTSGKGDEAFSVKTYSTKIENDLQTVISKIEGAGKTEVLLTMENSVEYVYLDNSTTKTKEIEPLIRGVLVVCEGGDDPVVVERVTDAVTKALDISTAKVCITKLSE